MVMPSSRFLKTTDTGIRVPPENPGAAHPFQARFLPPDIGTNRALPFADSLSFFFRVKEREPLVTKVD
jgi:hypothetical protein